MDFKIGKNGNNASNIRKRSERIMLIIIIIISLVSGLTVFLISNAIFGKKKTPEVVLEEKKIDINDENVQILYSYVAHNNRNKSSDKFITNKKVTLNTFTNEEKFFFALQFVQHNDLSFNNKYTENKEKIYLLSDSKIKSYMNRFFGSKVTYQNEEKLMYYFDFSINDKNLGVLEYSEEEKGYNVHFINSDDNETIINSEENNEQETIDNNENSEEINKLIEPYYTELYEAIRKIDNSIAIKEKVIYTELKEHDGTYELNIYKDYEKTKLIAKKTYSSVEEIEKNPIKMKDYLDNAGTVTYHFKVEGIKFYFDNSKITN